VTAPLRPDPSATCDACGAFGAFPFDGETLCADCYAGRGSCCSAEFSGHPPPDTPPLTGTPTPRGAPRPMAGPPPTE
jgi:hypothetical protein